MEIHHELQRENIGYIITDRPNTIRLEFLRRLDVRFERMYEDYEVSEKTTFPGRQFLR